MTENREPLRIFIAVDPTKIIRCEWCGIAESESWRRTQEGIFCSTDCHDAYRVYGRIFIFFVLVISFSIPLTIAAQFISRALLIVLLVLIILTFSPYLYLAAVGQKARKKVPRDSRRDDVTSDLALLKAVSSGVSCPKCSANIDIRTIGEDRVYRCEYCGASGIIEIVKTR